MKKIILILIVVIVLLAGCSSNKSRPVDKLKYPPLNEIKIPDVVTHTLSNGIKVYFLVNDKLPIVSVKAQAHSGDVTDPIDKIGLASLASGAITISSKNYSPDDLKQILNDNAISLNSYSSSRHSNVSMNYLVEDTELAFNIFADVLKNPTFDEQEFETQKTRTISNIYRRNDEASAIAFREFQKVLFGSNYPHNYQQEIYTINSITREDVQDFYSQYFYPNNITLTISGDFNIEEMKQLLEYHFATWYSPLKYKEINVPEPKTDTDSKVFVVDKPDASQTWVLIGHRSDLLLKDDDYAPMVLLNEILGGGFNSRVYKSVRVDKGLSYSPAGFLSVAFDRPGALYLLAPTSTETTLQAAEALVEEIRIITNEKVTKRELEFAKDSYFNSFVFRYERPEQMLYILKNYDYYKYDRNFANILKEKIEKVTIDDIYRVAQKYLKPDELIYLFVGNKSEFIDEVTSLGHVEEIDITIKESRDSEVMDYSKGKEVFFKFLNSVKSKKLINSLSTLSTVTSSSPIGDIDIDKTTVIVFPDKVSDTIRYPNGQMSIVVNNDKGVQIMGDQKNELTKEQITSMVDQIQLTYFGWLYDPSELTIGYLQDEIVDDVAYQVLKIDYKNSSMKLWMNKETNLPDFSIENMETAQGTMKIKSSFLNYQLNESVLCPMTIELTTMDGTPINTTNYKSIKFNGQIPDSTFDF